MQTLTGQAIKGYQLRECLGVGGFGAVYKAYQATVGREVAIKIILPNMANQPDFIRRFEAEAQVIARLEHPCVVPLYDYWRDPDGAFLVMRWLRGGSLSDLLKRGALDIDTISRILEQVAAALELAHRGNIIHRDIKPGNILLDEDGNAYLADFGIAKDLKQTNGSGTQMDAIVGSLDYISPEQARSEPVTARTDIYSLGVVLYEMLTGQHPFPGISSIERLYKHINDLLPDIITLDEAIRDAVNRVIQKATVKNPMQRYESATELAAALKEAVGLNRPVSNTTLVELFTQREQEVLHLLVAGQSNREIATKLVVTIATVKWYINEIFRKLRVRTRVQAVLRARELNLVLSAGVATTGTALIGIDDELLHAENPFKGLRAFQAVDERDFFGRADLVQNLLKRLTPPNSLTGGDESRFLAVVGPSGSGKSSVVKAGLIPALLRGGVPGSERWFVVEMLPGARPFDELEVALLRITPGQIPLREPLNRDDHGLLRVSNLILPQDDSEMVIVIDQFEEVFTLVEDERVRANFLKLMLTTVTDRRSRVRIVVTLRADFYDRPLNYPDFGDLLHSHMETILPLSAKGLEQAIAEPAKRSGVRFEEGLIATIVSDVNYQAGALPLLQYALTELFEQRQGRQITHEAYRTIGGAVGALAKRAEAIYQELPLEAQNITRQMFLRLVTPGEGTEDTRRRANRAELTDVSSDGGLLDEVIDVYTSYRLLSLDNDPSTRQPTIEVAHEAILREWDRLRRWVNESREDIRQQRELAALAADWQGHGQDGAYLTRESRLARLRVWADDTELNLTPLENDYLATCISAEAQRLAAERSQIERENRLRHQRQRILQGLVAVFLVAAVIAGWLAREANSQRDKAIAAEHEALRQASIGLAALARDSIARDIDRQTGVLLALEAVEHYPFTPQAVGALALAVEQYRPRRIFDSTGVMNNSSSVATWSPDGNRIASGGAGSPKKDSVAIWDVATGEIMLSTQLFDAVCGEPGYWLYDLVWSPDGARLAGVAKTNESGSGCGIVVMDSATGAKLLTFNDPGSPAWSLDWSPDGTTLVTGHEDGSIRLWDANTGTAKSTMIGHEGIVYAASFSPDGTRLATASSDGSVRLWDVATGDERIALWGHVGSVHSVWWSPDGTRIVSGGFDALPRVWDVATGQTLLVLAGHTDPVVSVSWSDDGRRIASQSFDATVKVWDAATGGIFFEIINVPPSGITKIGYAEFEPAGKWLVTGGGLVTGVELWDTSMSIPVLFGHSFGQEWGGWSPDGTFIATSGSDGSARVWDATTGEQVREFDQGSYYSDWSPDSKRLVSADTVDATALTVWDVTSGARLARLTPDASRLGAMFFFTTDWSPDGNYIAAAGSGSPSALFIWDAHTYELLSVFPAEDGCALGWPEWSPDSTRIVTGCFFVKPDVKTHARVWDARTGEVLMKLANPNAGWTYFTTWSPDGTQIMTSHDGATIVIWDVASGESVRTFTQHQGGFGSEAEWSPDGTLIASRGFNDNQLMLWDARTGEVLMSFALPGSPLNIAWSPDGTHIMISGDGLIEPIMKRVWRSTDDLITYAYQCCIFRELTPEERARFGLPQR